MTPEDLAAAAREAAADSYSPYSGFRVGAAAWDGESEPIAGTNVENAAYPSSSCAEANAIAAAIGTGIRELHTVAVACVDAGSVDEAYPCGRCRQIMAEFGVRYVVVTAGEGSALRRHTLDELLPHRFTL